MTRFDQFFAQGVDGPVDNPGGLPPSPRGQRWTTGVGIARTPSALWDAVDGGRVTEPPLTWPDTRLSTIHRPYDNYSDAAMRGSERQ